MRKALAAILMLSLLAVSVVNADGELVVKSEASKVITAYKSLITEGVPDKAVSLRLLDANDLEFYTGETVMLPINARSTEYEAFSWVLGGNIYGELTLSFSFGPMYLEDDDSSPWMIPYKVVLKHTSSRIGNTAIPTGKESGAATSILNRFTGYYFKYADSVTGSGASTEVESASKTISVVYNMSTYTKVTDVSNATVSYTGGVCDHWNRYGTAEITMDITADGKNSSGVPFSDGVYYASVVASVTAP
ncbi:MAG: hypothetical protein IJ863_01890 [Spirochaetales bacterium]|nr:hypothetical protein [Spirochaetales bacterium]